MVTFREWIPLLSQVTPSLTWTIALWVVVGIVTASTLFLFRTRWKGLSPVWKCAILSVIAHIILVAALYSTHLVLDSGGGGGVESFSVSLVDDTHESNADSKLTENVDNNIEPAIPPWEHVSDAMDLLQSPTLAEAAPQPVPIDLPKSLPEFVEPEPVAPESTLANADPAPEATRENSPPELPVPPVPRKEALAEPEALESPIRDEALAQPLSVEDAPAEPVAVADPPPLEALLTDTEPSPLVNPVQTNPDPVNESSVTPPAPDSNPTSVMPTSDLDQKTETDQSRTTPPVRNASTQPTDMTRPADGATLPTWYRNRVSGSRGEMARSLGGSVETETAVEQGLTWLASNQEATGQWNCARHGGGMELRVLGHDRDGAGSFADPGVTGLALLAFLGAGNTHFEGAWRENVQHGLEYLVSIQGADGSLAGPSKLYARMYCHSMATLALAEAYAMTGDDRLRAPVQKAVNYSLRSQDRRSGGWRYRPGDEGDMSQFGWQVMALKSARIGGIEIPQEADRLMVSFLNRCSGGLHGGLAGYRPGQPPTPTMTAEALLCRYLLQDSVDKAIAAEAATLIQRATPDPRAVNYYHWYYGTLAAFHAQGDLWQHWNRDLKTTLLSRQNHQGMTAGSWDPDGVWCGYGGRVYSTAMATLCLEVYYRYGN